MWPPPKPRMLTLSAVGKVTLVTTHTQRQSKLRDLIASNVQNLWIKIAKLCATLEVNLHFISQTVIAETSWKMNSLCTWTTYLNFQNTEEELSLLSWSLMMIHSVRILLYFHLFCNFFKYSLSVRWNEISLAVVVTNLVIVCSLNP